MYTKEEKDLILQAFCRSFGLTPIKGKQILEQAEWQPFVAQSMITQKTKTEKPKKPYKPKHTEKELAKAMIEKLHQRDNFDSQNKFGSSTHLLETALNQFPNSPEIQKQIYKQLDQPKNTTHKKRRKSRIF